jgi:hypothetical protein
MKNKRLELKLSVRGDGPLVRDSTRSSIRSNRSNTSNSSSGLPVSEIFATDRFTAIPHNTPFDINEKYNRRPIQYGYPAQSLQTLDRYDPSRYQQYEEYDRSSPYVDYGESSRRMQRMHYVPIIMEEPGYRPVYQDQPGYAYATLPRTPVSYEQYRRVPNSGHNTLPVRSNIRRVRISSEQPIVYGYGTLI